MKRAAYEISIVALLAAAAVACGGEEEGAVSLPDPDGDGEVAETLEAVSAPVLEVRREALTEPIHATGSTRAARDATLAAKLPGRIAALLVEEGDHVERNQVLARIDVSDVRLRAAQAEAQAAAQRAQAEQAAADYDRMAPLAESGAIAASKVQQLRSQRDALREAAAAAETAATAAQRTVSDGVLRAPFAGTVVEVPAEVGEMATGPGTNLVRVLDLSEIEVRVRVHERDLPRIEVGSVVTAHLPSVDRRVEGTVRRVGYEIDPRTRTAEVVTRIPNDDRTLRTGMFAEVDIVPSSGRDAIVVPRAAVVGSEEEPLIYVVEDGTAKQRSVRARPVSADRVEILEGLEPGETVVAGETSRVADGVEIVAASSGDDDALAEQGR